MVVSVSVSFCGENQQTEDCSDLARPVWNTVICFLLPSQDKGNDSYHSVKRVEMNGLNQDSKKRNKCETNPTAADKSDVSNK